MSATVAGAGAVAVTVVVVVAVAGTVAVAGAVAPEGGLADLAQELDDVAHPVESRKAAFKDDNKTFDAEAKAKQARELATEPQGSRTEREPRAFGLACCGKRAEMHV